jgi:DNA invertase Pin-like site-specific DNA recombinase
MSSEEHGTTILEESDAAGPHRNPDTAADQASAEPTTAAVIGEWLPRLAATRDAWAADLPPEAEADWTPGAAYIRVSSARSLGGDSPETQLLNTLDLMGRKRMFVGPEAVFFDVESGTDIGPRMAFKRLFEAAIDGGYKAIGVFINERMFRNLEQSIQIKRQFRLAGIQLVYLGMYEGDRRNPAAWQLETMQDTTAELHARNTSYYVGLTFEAASRAGRPVGKIPEVYRPKDRTRSFLGRKGSVVSWEVIEPLGSIMQEGCRRYLAGESFSQIATWAATTELEGVTPARRVMDKRWWYSVLRNPKFAGYQVPCVYTGFKPGKESPPRPRRTRNSELVPCILPPLWTLADYHAVLNEARRRWVGVKTRAHYNAYLLSGIAFDASCGHTMAVEQRKPDGRYWMGCRTLGSDGRHSKVYRTDIAAAELDRLIGSLRLDDDELRRRVEDELKELDQAQRVNRERFRPDPAIGALRQSLAALPDTGVEDLRAGLQSRIDALTAADAARRDREVRPLVEYRAALAQLDNWVEVWAQAGVKEKNQLLRDAAMRVEIGPLAVDTRKRGPGHVLRISAANPVFEAALAAALVSPANSGLGGQQTSCRPNADIQIRVRQATGAIRLPLHAINDGIVRVGRPVVEVRRGLKTVPPFAEDGLHVTTRAAARQLEVGVSAVIRMIQRGVIHADRTSKGGVPWYRIPQTEIDRYIAERERQRAA